MQVSERRPPHTANIGQACYKCFIAETGVSLRKCSKCLRVAYCGIGCQEADWAQHEAMCRVLNALERPLIPKFLSFVNLDLDSTNRSIKMRAKIEVGFYKLHIKRAFTASDRNLVEWEPRCMACGTTDRDFRREAVRNSSSCRSLIPCSACRMTFYCCAAHQEAIQDLHISPVSPEAQSQCQINQETRADIKLVDTMTRGGAVSFHWAPERTKESWTSVKGLGWEDEFATDLKRHFGLTETAPLGPWIRGVSAALSMPMSILWALEMLNGADEGWTRKSVLTVHIMGVCQSEAMSGQIFEEILHRLPEVKTLNLVLCGPQLSRTSSSSSSEQFVDMETCPECQRKHRKMVHYHYSETYHDFMRGHGITVPKPDLAVAFSGASMADTSSWQETMVYLVQNQIPSLFTAYNQGEARGGAELLMQAGAQLIFGPAKNPWGSIMMMPEPMRVSGFYAVNEWVVGIFGR